MLQKAFELAWLPQQDTTKVKIARYPHRKVIEALEKGDPEECEWVMRNHIQHSKQVLLEKALSLKLNCFEESNK